MTDNLTEKLKMKVDLNKINSFIDVFQKYTNGFYNFFRDKKNNSTIMLLMAVTTSALAIYFGVQLYNDITVLKGKTPELVNISSYDSSTLAADAITQNILKNSDTIQDLLQENKSAQAEISKYTDYLHALQVPYNYFLKYVYLPSLNIWKENYTDKIDIDLI